MIYLVSVKEHQANGSEDTTPCCFFSNEKDANEFAKELKKILNKPHGLYDPPEWGYKEVLVQMVPMGKVYSLPF